MITSKFEILAFTFVKLFMLVEFLFSIYLLNLLVGLWWSVGFIFLIILGMYITVIILSAIHIKANSLKDYELWSQQNTKAMHIFYSITENILFFPVRAIIVYYIYSEFQQGVLYILLYLLFLVGDTRARQHINAVQANNAFNELNKNT